MIVFETPFRGIGGGLRVMSLGSCRVRNPLAALARRGDLRITAGGLQATHTAAEALQSLDIVNGLIRIPADLRRYVFNSDDTPPLDRLRLALDGGVDVVLLEVSDAQQFSFEGTLLQQNFLAQHFVRPHGGALLAWYRRLCFGNGVSEVVVRQSLERLRRKGFVADAAVEAFLRGVRLDRHAENHIVADLTAIKERSQARLAVIGSVAIPGENGDIMGDRRRLNRDLRKAAKSCGAQFYDPSRLLSRHGRSTVLASGGADIYEFAPEFYPVVGEALIGLAVRRGSYAARSYTSPSKDKRRSSAPPSAQARARLAAQVNASLLDLHRDRLLLLGRDESGLYAHYERLIDRGELVGQREISLFEIASAYLPAYEAYSVLRAGLGEAALLFAASGRRVTAHEPDRRRRVALEAGAARLAQCGLLAPHRLTVSPLPCPAENLGKCTLGLGLDAVMARDETGADSLLKRMAVFEALLVSLRTFVSRNGSIDDQLRVASRLSELGLAHRRDYPADTLTWFRRAHYPARA